MVKIFSLVRKKACAVLRKPENSMDPRIVAVLRAVAFEDVDVVGDERYCHYCDGRPSEAPLTDRIEHRPDCFTLQVRAVLRDYGMPLCVFKVTLEILQEDGAWCTQTHFYPGFDARKLRSGLLPNAARRNLHIEKVAEL